MSQRNFVGTLKSTEFGTQPYIPLTAVSSLSVGDAEAGGGAGSQISQHYSRHAGRRQPGRTPGLSGQRSRFGHQVQNALLSRCTTQYFVTGRQTCGWMDVISFLKVNLKYLGAF